MPRVTISEVGKFGIIRDIAPIELPPEAWSDGNNVRFLDKKVEKMKGEEAVYGTPTVAPYGIVWARESVPVGWLYQGLDDIYHVDDTPTHTKITRTSGVYTGAVGDHWRTTFLNGMPVMTNGIDDPQSWNPLTPATKLVDLPNWPANWECKIIKAFQNHLCAYNITKSSANYNSLISWSQSADPGTLPASWDVTDATIDAGDNPNMADTNGAIFDVVSLRDQMIIYKEDAFWSQQFIGGNYIFGFKRMFSQGDVGILAPRCAVPLPKGSRHFVVTPTDIIIHNGQDLESILTERWRSWLWDNMDSDNSENTFVIPNYLRKEIWVCFPSQTAISGIPNKALIWNYDNNTLSSRDIPAAFAGALGKVIPPTSQSWDADSGTWDDDASDWIVSSNDFTSREILLACPTATLLKGVERLDTFNGTNMTSFVQREGLAVFGKDSEGKPKSDFSLRKLWTGLYPKIEGTGPVDVRVGVQEKAGGAITWATSQSFIPGTDDKLDFALSGRLLAIEFKSSGATNWKLSGYDLEVQPLGKF